REAAVLSGGASGMCDRIPGAVTGAASARGGHGLDSRFLQERLPPRVRALAPPCLRRRGSKSSRLPPLLRVPIRPHRRRQTRPHPELSRYASPYPQPQAPVTTPADRRALTASLPPLQDADARAIEAFVDAIWAESGLARQTLDSYRRDLEGYARWRGG